MEKQSEMWQLKKRLKKLSPTEFVEIFDVATPRKQRELAKRGVETSGRHTEFPRLDAWASIIRLCVACPASKRAEASF